MIVRELSSLGGGLRSPSALVIVSGLFLISHKDYHVIKLYDLHFLLKTSTSNGHMTDHQAAYKSLLLYQQ